MKLERMTVSRLRSVKNASLEECGLFNVLVGKNNCGKSTLLSAINAFFLCVSDGQIITLDPPFGEIFDFYQRDTGSPIDIEIDFSLKLAERDELVRNIGLEAPQLRHAIDGLDPSAWLSVILAITSRPVRFAYIRKIALVNSNGAEPHRALFSASPNSASELQVKYRNLGRAKMDSEKLAEAAKKLDEEDFRRIRESSAPVSRHYITRNLTEATPMTLQTFESLVRDSGSHKEFRRSALSISQKILEEAKALNAEPLKNPVETFSGDESEIPKYVYSLLQSLANLKVLYLHEHRKPLGREEAQRLLELKVRRGGNESLRSIQETVQALLGVRIDAFEGSSHLHKGAEMDVDDFLLEVNGSGIREALRLVLDYEFKHPDILLVEEPEVHLHPALEIAMMGYLKRVSERCQVFLSTHSTNFLDGGDMSNVYLVSKAQDTAVQLLNLEETQARIPKELGLRLSSLFMFDRLIFVEGPSDEAVLRELSRKIGVNLAQRNVGFVSMGGVRNFTHYATEAIMSFLSKRQVDLWFILDHDENDVADVERIKLRLGGRASLHVLQKRELENYLLSPRAISAFLEVKMQTSPRSSLLNSVECITTLLDKNAENLKGFALAKRVAKCLCRPAFIASSIPEQITETQVKDMIDAKLSEFFDEVSVRKSHLGDIFTKELDSLDGTWATSKQDVVPGPELLDNVFKEFGVRFRKETDSPRLASFLETSEIDIELRDLIQSLGK